MAEIYSEEDRGHASHFLAFLFCRICLANKVAGNMIIFLSYIHEYRQARAELFLSSVIPLQILPSAKGLHTLLQFSNTLTFDCSMNLLIWCIIGSVALTFDMFMFIKPLIC